jgi:NAD-dependent deacetylase
VPSDLSERIRSAAQLVRSAESILAITGAGISADSGLPTYRGVQGLYDGKLTEDGLTTEQALSARVFRTHPEITWKYMSQIESGARGKTFNRGHQVLAWLEQTKPRVWVLTQNIDGFHFAAGSRNVIEIHGTMHRIRCIECQRRERIDDYLGLSLPPRCSACGGLQRPDVVLFDEYLPSEAIATLERETARGFDLYLSIGTSNTFPYILQPILQARSRGLPTIEINPAAETDISRLVTLHLPLGAAEALRLIAEELTAN